MSDQVKHCRLTLVEFDYIFELYHGKYKTVTDILSWNSIADVTTKGYEELTTIEECIFLASSLKIPATQTLISGL
jgi:hypothetical protein